MFLKKETVAIISHVGYSQTSAIAGCRILHTEMVFTFNMVREKRSSLLDPLHPRDAFYGGRLSPPKLVVRRETNNIKSKYVDFISLYRDINKNCVYSVVHATMLSENINHGGCRYFGLIKCDALQHRGLIHPVSWEAWWLNGCRVGLGTRTSRVRALTGASTLCS